MKKIKTGIIGSGFIGPAHIEALRRLGFVEVIALADVDEKTARARAGQLNIPSAYGNYRELLKNKDIDAIHNCTPNYLHFRITKDALLAGKHVVSEKPLAMNSGESERLVSLAKKMNLVNAVDFNYRFYPLIQEAKEMVRTNRLGKIYAVHGSYLQDWLLLETDYNWRLDAKLGGRSRAVADIGSHWCDLIQFITGLKITSVYADIRTVLPFRKRPKGEIETFKGKQDKPKGYQKIKIKTEDYGSVLLKFDNGAPGVFTVSQVSAGRKNRLWFEIDAEKCSLCWDQERPKEMGIGYRDKPNEILPKDPSLLSRRAGAYAHYPGGHPEGYPDGPRNLFENVYRFILKRKGKPEFPTFQDGHNEIVITEAVLESQRRKKWVGVRY